MSEKRFFQLLHAEARRRAVDCIQSAPDGYSVVVSAPTRNLNQNAALWPILDAFAEQLEWPIGGRLTKMTAEEWKAVLTAAFRRENVRLAMALDGGGFVMLGSSTSQFSVREMSDFLEFLHATAAERGVAL